MDKGFNTSKLTIGFSSKKVQEDISFHLPASSILAILGENGSGKSTFIKTLGGILPVLGGEMFLNQQAFGDLSLLERAKQMAFVLTDRVDLGLLSVEEFIAFGRYPYNNWLAKQTKEDIAHIEQAIAYCGLESFRQSSLLDLSDGERQKVMVARAIAQSTPFIVLDEPTTHLDFRNSKQIFSLIQNLKHKGKTILFSTHQLEAAAEIADYFLLFKMGAWRFCDRANYSKGEQYCNFLMED